GTSRPIEGALASVLDRLRAVRSRFRPPLVLAIDLPSGVDPDSGAADPHAAPADRTVALGFSKVGLHVLPGSQYAGAVEVVDIGLPEDGAEGEAIDLVDRQWVRSVLPPRPLRANKGSFGRVLIVAGSMRYTGADQ